jgi:hypothetical protein
MEWPPEIRDELDRNFEIWMQKLTVKTASKRILEAARNGTHEDFMKECSIQFLAEELESAMIAHGDYVSLPIVKSDGTITHLWDRRKA